MKTIRKTNLEESSDVVDTLKWKMQTIESNKLPVESGLADYIALGIDNLENKISFIDSIMKQYKNEKDDIKKQIESIKIDGAKFFNEYGIVKIDGVICSSITVTKEKQATTTEVITKVFTPLISNAEIEELLIGLGKAEMKTVVIEKTSNYIPAKLRVNKRKKIETQDATKIKAS